MMRSPCSTPLSTYSWQDDTWTHHDTPSERAAWREAVADIAAKAKATFPECAGRVDAAVKIVLVGDVELLLDDSAKVASQSRGLRPCEPPFVHQQFQDFDDRRWRVEIE
jgi:hypothetical protein